MKPMQVGLSTGNESMIRLSPLASTEGTNPFRRGNAVRRSRRGLLKRRLKRIVLLLALIAAPSAIFFWLMTSPRFAVRELTITTGERVSEVWVRDALASVLGANLPRLQLEHAADILSDHPWVLGADLRKDLPARLTVRVTERHAIALLRAQDGLHYVDARGERIAPLNPTAERDVNLPLISVRVEPQHRESATIERTPPEANTNDSASESEAASTPTASPETTGLRSAIQLLSEIDDTEPSWAVGLSEIEVLGEEDFRVHTAALPFSVLVSTGTLTERARRLEELMPYLVARFGAGTAVDLRFARRIIVQPSVESGESRLRPGPSRAGRSRNPSVTEHQEATSNHAQRG